MSKTSAFELSIEGSELGAFLGGLLIAAIQSEVAHFQADVERALGHVPTDAEWARMKEGAYRKAFERIVKCFPAAIRPKVAAIESDIIAAVMDLN